MDACLLKRLCESTDNCIMNLLLFADMILTNERGWERESKLNSVQFSSNVYTDFNFQMFTSKVIVLHKKHFL